METPVPEGNVPSPTLAGGPPTLLRLPSHVVRTGDVGEGTGERTKEGRPSLLLERLTLPPDRRTPWVVVPSTPGVLSGSRGVGGGQEEVVGGTYGEDSNGFPQNVLIKRTFLVLLEGGGGDSERGSDKLGPGPP